MTLRYTLLALLAALLVPSAAAQNDIIITGVVDGPLPGGVPKAVEFYVVNDVANLSTYGFGSANNADGTNGVEFAFPAVAASAGETFYLASETGGFTSFFGFAPDYTSGAAGVNGDDSLELFYDVNGVVVAPAGSVPATTSVVDVFGVVGTDGSGEPWEYSDGWAYRKADTGPDGSTFVIDNWTFSGTDALDGQTTNSTATTPFPAGTYGGTPPAAEAVTLSALLRGENEVPPVETNAKGGVTLVLDGTTLTVSGSFAGLQSDYNANIGSHIHGGAANENKKVIVPLVPTLNGDLRGGSWSAANNTFTIRQSFADSIRAGLAYVNVHSVGTPGGEIRGQIGTGAQSLPFALSGANEVPPNTSPATGSGTVTLDGSMVTVTGTFSGLTGDYRMSHIHAGAAGANGPVVQGLAPTVAADMRGGSWEVATNTFTVRATFADSIRAGLAYVNVHSSEFPSGEIRGQIGTAAPLMMGTVAAARAQGVGAVVNVRGVVTRAKGSFVYFQDATAGLVVRQAADAPSTEFRDAIAAGTIKPGTTLEVTGTLSEFNGLLQINSDGRGNNLDSYVVGEAVAVPAAQAVTLAQLAAAGETYESELVAVQNVTFAGAGGTFASGASGNGANYSVTDPSDNTGTVPVRVIGTDDTDVDGLAIPTGPATVTGVVGQFDGTDPRDSGYQLQPILASDVVQGTAGETGPEGVISLTVANPVQGSARVRFELTAPGRATVALFDALGRQVAVLADGAIGAGEQTATLEAGALATGVYVLRLQTETGTASRTLTVVR